MAGAPENYIEVPERIREFKKEYPEGSLVCKSIEYRMLPVGAGQDGTIIEKLHVIYQAAAYRTPHDHRPGIGTASEPIPGMTNFTRGSELMNAETSAWGRALAALGFVSKRDGSAGVATANEVRARQNDREGGQGASYGQPPKASEKQIELIRKLAKERKWTVNNMKAALVAVGAPDATEIASLTVPQAKELIDGLMGK